MADRNMLIRALLLGAKKTGPTPAGALESIILGKFTAEFSNGSTVISTSEAGGNVTFSLMSDLTPGDVAALAMECLSRLKAGDFGDEEDPDLVPRRIKRLRVSFAKAVIS